MKTVMCTIWHTRVCISLVLSVLIILSLKQVLQNILRVLSSENALCNLEHGLESLDCVGPITHTSLSTLSVGLVG